MGSVDLIEFQVGKGRGGNPYCRECKGKKMSPCESLMNSEESLDQQGVLTGEDQKRILMIRGIKVFLLYSLAEAGVCVANATIVEGQPPMTVKEMEQMSEATQG
jgi:hypothetical protein